MPDPNDHGAMIAAAFERMNAQQRDIDRVDSDVDQVEDSLGDQIRKLDDKIEILIKQNAEMRGIIGALKWIVALLLGIGTILGALFSGALTPPHH